ncbi:hypothetical protein KSD_69970 [Ktedonobacter sp. SOSP1-85]|uniref:helix-turn-helix domain-containing protein n=1 Tax=Ktedonobacter sp. SOSP1-85 TaxID=2778367 RepID=UPI001916091E|nr:helix-turn-helix domain-containing protein [Ktedonobacter sp. SOSP1-85]GHO79226.1 hypothetical protein KSD_69970 [Ktedonobacter sp. SOSP1-85]
MRTPLYLRPLSEEEGRVIGKLVRSQTASVRLIERARVMYPASQGRTIPQIMSELHPSSNTVRKWFKRFEKQRLSGLEGEPRSGAPSRYTPENKALVVQTARTRPVELGLPYQS